RGTIADLTWPATTPGRLQLVSTVQGGGTLEVTGMLRSPPDPTQLRVRVSKLDLAPWAQLIPLEARVSGIAEADLRMNEPLAAGIPARVQGTIAVKGLGVADARQDVLGAQRIEARGLEVQWPTRVVIERVLVTGPRGLVERDRTGGFPLIALLGHPPSASSSTIDAARHGRTVAPRRPRQRADGGPRRAGGRDRPRRRLAAARDHPASCPHAAVASARARREGRASAADAALPACRGEHRAAGKRRQWR